MGKVNAESDLVLYDAFCVYRGHLADHVYDTVIKGIEMNNTR